MLVALGACSSVDVVGILEKRKVTLTHYEVQVSAEQDEDPPWTFRKIHLKYILAGKDLNEKDVQKAIELSEGKYCSVAATLKGKAEITTEYVIEPEGDMLKRNKTVRTGFFLNGFYLVNQDP